MEGANETRINTNICTWRVKIRGEESIKGEGSSRREGSRKKRKTL